jgi:hypothetical protein
MRSKSKWLRLRLATTCTTSLLLITITVPNGYYTSSELVTYINDLLMADAAFLANLTTETAALELNAQNYINWM